MTGDIDRSIEDGEGIVRGVCTPFHYDKKKNKLKKGAFKPKTPTTGVSVFRSAILDSHACKSLASKLAGDGKQYVGLAAFFARSIRITGASVEDSREHYYGHADLLVCNGYLDQLEDHSKGDPLPPQIQEILDDRISKLIEAAVFHFDPSPSSERWTGSEPLI